MICNNKTSKIEFKFQLYQTCIDDSTLFRVYISKTLTKVSGERDLSKEQPNPRGRGDH